MTEHIGINIAELREASHFTNDPAYLVEIAGLAADEIERLRRLLETRWMDRSKLMAELGADQEPRALPDESQLDRYARALREPAKAFSYCHPDTLRDLIAIVEELRERRAGDQEPV